MTPIPFLNNRSSAPGGLSRRGFFAGAAALGVAGALSSCSLPANAPTGAGSTAGAGAGATATSGGPALSGGADMSNAFKNLQLSEQARQKSLTIAFLVQQLSAQSGQHSLAAFQKYVADEKLPWRVNVLDAKGDPGTLSAQMTDAATARVDAMVVAYGTLTAAQGALAQVAKAKVPLITLDSGYFPPAVCDITSNNYAVGAGMSDFMVSRLQSQGKTTANICVVYANFHHGTRRRGRTLDALLKENEWINVLDSKIIEYEAFYETTLNTTTNWISRFGKDIDAIWCPWDEPAEAASEAILRNGMSRENIFVVGADGTQNAVAKMKAENYPQIVTVAQAFELWSPMAALFIGQIAAEGKPAREVVPIAQVTTPTPTLVTGVNLPEADVLPWRATDFSALIEQRSLVATGLGK